MVKSQEELVAAINRALKFLSGSPTSALAHLPAGGVECEAQVERAVDELREAIGLERRYRASPAQQAPYAGWKDRFPND